MTATRSSASPVPTAGATGARAVPAQRRHSHDLGEPLYIEGRTAVHELAAEIKIVALLLFVLAVVATPPRVVWAFLAYGALLAALAAVARLSPGAILPRMLVELPFLLFALMLPLIGADPQVVVGGLELSQPGLLAAWGIIAKGTIGVVGSIILAATTPTRDLLVGLQRLRVPDQLVQIASFMIRYTQVVSDQVRRMSIARRSRGFQETGLKAWPILARSAGALFIRSYERGERVHLAMLSRGYAGRMPPPGQPAPQLKHWLAGMSLPLVGWAIWLAAVSVPT